MRYASYIRAVPGAQTAVLCLHGIVGTPAHFKDLLPLIPDHWSVYNILLDGHGKDVKAFARTSMTKWKVQVSATIDEILSTHSQVLIVAHSMGTLFAIEEAVKHPGQVCGLFLLAVPLVFHVRFSAAIGSLQAALGRFKPGSVAERMAGDSGVRLSPKLWKYIPWLPRFWELTQEAVTTRKRLPHITIPCWAFQSGEDELVGTTSTKILRKHPHITTTVLPHSGHFHHSAEDLALLQTTLQEIIATIH